MTCYLSFNDIKSKMILSNKLNKYNILVVQVSDFVLSEVRDQPFDFRGWGGAGFLFKKNNLSLKMPEKISWLWASEKKYLAFIYRQKKIIWLFQN